MPGSWGGRFTGSGWRRRHERADTRLLEAGSGDLNEGGEAMRIKMILAMAALSVAGHAAVAQEPAGTLEKIRSTGTIAIGHRESSIPFSYYDDNEKVVGYAIDLCYLAVDA